MKTLILRFASVPEAVIQFIVRSVRNGWRLGFILTALAAAPLLASAAPNETAQTNANENTLPAYADLREDHLVDKWTADDGLPQSSIFSIAQTPDGYLWLATFAGLVRFDGLRFTVFDAANTPQLASSRIVFLKVDSKGALWILSEYGDMARFEDGRFTAFTSADGLPPTQDVGVFAEDRDGNFWVPGEKGQPILRFEKEKFITGVPLEPAMQRHYQMLIATHDGQIWGTGGNILTHLRPGEVIDYFFNPDGPNALAKTSDLKPSQALQIRYLQASRDGGIWVASFDGLRKFRDGRWQVQWRSPIPMPSLANLYEDRAGKVWIGTWHDGLLQFDSNGRLHRYRLTDSPSHEPVRSFFEDREGNFWIGTIGPGLFRVKPPIIRTYGTADGLNTKTVNSVTVAPDGTVWILNTADQIHRLQQKKDARIERVSSGISDAWCNLADRDGSTWVGTLRDGLFRYRNDEWVRYPFDAAISSLFQDRGGTLWIGAFQTFARFDGNGIRTIPHPPGIEVLNVSALADDGQGHLYVGSNDKGLFRYSGGQWTQFSKSDGLPDQRVWSLYVDTNDIVWIGGYDRGLSRLKDGKIFSFLTQPLRLPGQIGGILEDNFGNLWLSSNHGIYRVSKKELNDFADGKINSINTLYYTQRDGLATSECTSGMQPVAAKGGDGRLWFATMAGAAVVDPSRLPRNSVPPPIAIEEVFMDDVGVAKRDGMVTIPPGKHRLEIHFTALSLTAPEKLRFRYQLENFDQNWVDAGGSRIAHYTAVTPGRYRFRVSGSNNDGVWSESNAMIAMVIQPYYWQTGWFRFSVLASFLGLGLLVYNRRIATLQRERLAQTEFSRRLIESQEQERKRISAELHDGLGQSLLLIRTRAMVGRSGAAASANTNTEQMEAISEAALQAINEVRSIAYDLRPYELDRLGVTKAIEAVAQRAAEAAGFRTELDLELIDDLLPPEFEINLYRIVQEAVTNTVKYARAKTLTVTLKSESKGLHLTVRDDGCGFANPSNTSSPSAKGGLGLVGISERAKIMGGRVEFVSAPGQGTRLTVFIPLPHHEQK